MLIGGGEAYTQTYPSHEMTHLVIYIGLAWCGGHGQVMFISGPVGHRTSEELSDGTRKDVLLWTETVIDSMNFLFSGRFITKFVAFSLLGRRLLGPHSKLISLR